MANQIANDILMHYGMPRRSGRYPYGSGDNPYQHGNGDVLARIDEMKKQGMSQAEIARALGYKSTNDFRPAYAAMVNEERRYLVAQAKSLKAQGMSNVAIAKEMGLPNESSVRSLLNPDSEERMNRGLATSEFLKSQVDEKGMIDIGKGVERELNISREQLDEALYILKEEGYNIYGGRISQINNPGKSSTQMVLTTPDKEHKDIYDLENVHSVTDYISDDDGETFRPKFVYPESMDSGRLQVVYAEDGGAEKDGLVELRRGVDDLDLGASNYAQVRILVDGTHYIKGMAVYGEDEDFPDGVDVIFNVSKTKDVPIKGDKKSSVLKPIDDDPTNPFGANIKEEGGQSYYEDADGNKKLSLINKRAEQGDWGDWEDTLPSQFLSKQNKQLIEKQINLSVANKQAEYDEIMSCTNPEVKKKLLMDFANECDTTAVHLDAASLPRQRWNVIVPSTTLSDNEVYAPGYSEGEKVALVRYPHGGTFEIPILTVTHKNEEAEKKIGRLTNDAVCINSKVAARLSGADFDGDTVMIIPTHDSAGKVKISSKQPLKDLEGFDPKYAYPYTEGTKTMKKGSVQREMGQISNLITDMTIKGASDDELARAVKHSMVVIDAYKHKLDYKQSEIDNDIQGLKDKYQAQVDPETGKVHYGASTIISKAKSQASVNERQGSGRIDPETGEMIFKESGRVKTKTNSKTGEVTTEKRTTKSTKMAETDDAFDLVSEGQYPVEIIYANYANKMKSMANKARKEYVSTKGRSYSKEAKEKFSSEVKHLLSQLNEAEKNAPVEREAQRIANSKLSVYKEEHPEASKAELKKKGQRYLSEARSSVGAHRNTIHISEKEWEAIQAGAVSNNTLSSILIYADPDEVRSYAMPRSYTTISSAKKNKITAMAESNYTIGDIAEACGCSTSAVEEVLSGV